VILILDSNAYQGGDGATLELTALNVSAAMLRQRPDINRLQTYAAKPAAQLHRRQAHNRSAASAEAINMLLCARSASRQATADEQTAMAAVATFSVDPEPARLQRPDDAAAWQVAQPSLATRVYGTLMYAELLQVPGHDNFHDSRSGGSGVPQLPCLQSCA
jgi:hypothetical protein